MTETAYGTYIKDYFYIKMAQQFSFFFITYSFAYYKKF